MGTISIASLLLGNRHKQARLAVAAPAQHTGACDVLVRGWRFQPRQLGGLAHANVPLWCHDFMRRRVRVPHLDHPPAIDLEGAVAAMQIPLARKRRLEECQSFVFLVPGQQRAARRTLNLCQPQGAVAVIRLSSIADGEFEALDSLPTHKPTVHCEIKPRDGRQNAQGGEHSTYRDRRIVPSNLHG